MSSCTAKNENRGRLVAMGQLQYGRPPDCFAAILGSCIGVTLYHTRKKLGALAHVVLAESAGRPGPPCKFADTAIPHLLEIFEKELGTRTGIVAKIAGGAAMFGGVGPMQIGEINAAAVKKELQAAKVRFAGEHVGGDKGRRITFDCATGDLIVQIVGNEPLTI